MKKITRILIITCMTWWVTSSPAYATGLEVSVNGGPWALETLGPNAEQTSNQWTVTGSTDGTIDISAKVSDGHATPWTAGGINNGAGTYGLKTNVGTIIPITAGDTTWMDDATTGPHRFGLWFLSPSSQSGAQQGQHTLTVTLTASDYCGPLTWSDSTHTGPECKALTPPGTVYDTGATGTICKYTGSTVPTGWTQAANWQRYDPASWGGDDCYHNYSTGPSSFANQTATLVSNAGGYMGLAGCGHSYCADGLYWCTGAQAFTKNTTYSNTSTNRVEIGIK